MAAIIKQMRSLSNLVHLFANMTILTFLGEFLRIILRRCSDYIGSDDLQETLSKIEAAGGRTLMPPTEVPGEGWFALFADPDGNTLGLWKSTNPG